MRLRHFSDEPIKTIRSTDQAKLGTMKPSGFWVSDESAEGWSKWSIENEFRLESMAYEYKVNLKRNANILYLRTKEDLDNFTEEYKDFSEGTSNDYLSSEFRSSQDLKQRVFEINWKAISEKYQGIMITPYIRQRWDHMHMWYSGWDCASGCIWDKEAISSIKLVDRHAIPEDYKPFNIDEWGKEARDVLQTLEKITRSNREK